MVTEDKKSKNVRNFTKKIYEKVQKGAKGLKVFYFQLLTEMVRGKNIKPYATRF